MITRFIQACMVLKDAEPLAAGIAGALVREYWERLVERETASDSHVSPDLLELRPRWDAAASNSRRDHPTAPGSELGRLAEHLAKLDVLEAGYWIGMVYTALLPRETRGRLGVYYTPPPLTERLLDLAEQARRGLDGRTRARPRVRRRSIPRAVGSTDTDERES